MHTAKALPPIVSRAEWEVARAELLVREKELFRLKDAVSAQRRRLPMVQIDEPYVFDTESGPLTLLDLFDGRSQLIVQHFMFGSDWDEGCSGCSMMADHIGPLSHLYAKDTSLVLVSRAPVGKIVAFKDRMEWDLPWVSSGRSTFNEDFRVTVDGEERHAISAFLRDGDRVFHTWQTFDRGEEPFMVVFDLLDVTAYGRQETWEDSPQGWPQKPPYEWMRLHDAYES
ncbi:DUF899 domain-containing protein [Mycolicibacterium iranicum]|jgi:predicted dithiol-disulfide oxidoreductase (DUF899 family)|uniref:Thioredoxin n=1 Tax=Mycolicibacterium iranicum TaxID=912594 RepID=A0A1X1WAY3_MYCIR|nr:DUF899 domain-containing protein [Mycolicibacterium iranicum]ORV83670.1 hypothetical protein AWC12_25165 [Mycolicibacterium iranicum]